MPFMIPRTRPDFDWPDLIHLVLNSHTTVEQFEAQFLKTYQYQEAIWFPSARVAIQTFLLTGGQNWKGKQVAVSPFNCTAIGIAIRSSGFTPYYVDTRVGGFSQDPQKFTEALSQKEVSVGLAIPMWGESIDRFQNPGRKPILFDYALKGLDVTPAPLQERDAAVYSFNLGKPISSFQGGILATNNIELSKTIRAWRNAHIHGATSQLPILLSSLKSKIVFHPMLFGAFYRAWKWSGGSEQSVDDSQDLLKPEDNRFLPRGALGLGVKRMKLISDYMNERQRQIAIYDSGLSSANNLAKNIKFIQPEPWLSHYPLIVDDRASLKKHLIERQIFTSTIIFDRLLSDFPLFHENGPARIFPNAKRLTETTLQLPLFHGLNESEQDRVVEAVRDWK